MNPDAQPRQFNIAVLALGGQGGGVLVDWIVQLAEQAGWTAQSTSVAGVAQRTGATLYYIEIVEPTPGRRPVLALMPVPGEVDVLIAAELMEAGRAVERGLVTPGRTQVVASSHRVYSVQEKMVPGNGLADSAAVLAGLRASARHAVIADLQALAVMHGSVISASLFGALAAGKALPFTLADHERVVQRSATGVVQSLAACRAAARLAVDAQCVAAPVMTPQVAHFATPQSMQQAARPLPRQAASSAMQPLLDRVRRDFPRPAWDWLGEGLARVADWQDIDHAAEYLDRVAPYGRASHEDDGHALCTEAARWIAVAMSYDDVIRVADLKTRAERSARLRDEVQASRDDVFGSEEYFHPRLEEVMGLLPCALADWMDRHPRWQGWLKRRLDRGRRIQAQRLGAYLTLRLLAGLRRWRRGNRRHAQERAHLEAWLAAVDLGLLVDPALAVEMLRCRRLIKGYSDTHARGGGRFDQLMAAARVLCGQPDAAVRLATMREAALHDAEGQPGCN